MNEDLKPNISNIDLKGCKVGIKLGSCITLTVDKLGNEIVEKYDPKGISEIRKRLNRGGGNYIKDRIKVFVEVLSSDN